MSSARIRHGLGKRFMAPPTTDRLVGGNVVNYNPSVTFFEPYTEPSVRTFIALCIIGAATLAAQPRKAVILRGTRTPRIDEMKDEGPVAARFVGIGQHPKARRLAQFCSR